MIISITTELKTKFKPKNSFFSVFQPNSDLIALLDQSKFEYISKNLGESYEVKIPKQVISNLSEHEVFDILCNILCHFDHNYFINTTDFKQQLNLMVTHDY